MKITKSYLKRVIKEETEKELNELNPHGMYNTVQGVSILGGHGGAVLATLGLAAAGKGLKTAIDFLRYAKLKAQEATYGKVDKEKQRAEQEAAQKREEGLNLIQQTVSEIKSKASRLKNDPKHADKKDLLDALQKFAVGEEQITKKYEDEESMQRTMGGPYADVTPYLNQTLSLWKSTVEPMLQQYADKGDAIQERNKKIYK